MEEQRKELSATSEQRIFYFENGCDVDGVEIVTPTQAHTTFELISRSVYYDLGVNGKAIIDDKVLPAYRNVINKLFEI